MSRSLVGPTVAIALIAAAAAAQTEERPRDVGLVERAGRRLVQIDITALGSPAVVSQLTAEDFRIKVMLERVRDFSVDRLCAAAGDPVVDPAHPATFLLYFDQPHLTLGGRQAALELARELVSSLVRDGNRAMILSDNRELDMVEPLTGDAQLLLQALDRLADDRSQYDTYADQEDSRVAEVARTLSDNWDQSGATVESAANVARRHQMEEVFRAERSMRRLSGTLNRLADTAPPKAVLYFADTLRSNPGEHYLAFFGQRVRDSRVALLNIATDAAMARSPFDRIVTEAVALGIRFYPVLPRGMSAELDTEMISAGAISRGGGSPLSSRARYQQARESLATLAAETGGYAFLHGQRGSKMLERIEQDLGCLYVASFDPGEFPEDVPLRIAVETSRPGVELRVRGQIVVQSESARITSRVLRAFSEPSASESSIAGVRAGIVPTGFGKRGFSALLQVVAPGLPLPSATWDLGASVIHRGRVVAETSKRLSVSQPGVPVIYEAELEFEEGDYEIVAVAHELATGVVASHRLSLRWPDPDGSSATVTPIAVLQPAHGAFQRADRTRLAGSLAQDPADPVQAARPTALVGLVCHDGGRSGTLEVARSLVGETTVAFPPLSFDLGAERCAQVRDLVPAGRLGEGYYRYEIRVSAEGKMLFEGARDFLAVAPAR